MPRSLHRDHSAREIFQDSFFLGVIVLLSCILYISQLGFYSDDWAVLGIFSNSPDQSLKGLFESFYTPEVYKRPVQILYYASLYRMFDLHPIGHHLFNNSVFLFGVILFYLVLRELGHPRLFALAVSATFSQLPHFSADRFWFMSFQINLSMTCYFLSFFCDLRTLQTAGLRLWGFKALSIVALLASVLSYELFLPLFFINPLLVWYQRKRLHGSSIQSRTTKEMLLLTGIHVAILTMAIVFKAVTANRFLLQKPSDHVLWFLQLILDSLRVSYGTYGIGLPFVLKRILHLDQDWRLLGVGGLTGVLIFLCLYRTSRQSIGSDLPTRAGIRSLIFCGLAVFVLGYVIFLGSENTAVTPTGINNRVAIAAATGVALSMVAAVGWLSSILPSDRSRRLLFCCLISLLCTSGFLINNKIAKFWVSAYSKQQEVISDIGRHIGELPNGGTLMLDGICPYVGPGIVFEASWDLTGALSIAYPGRGLNADIIRPNTLVADQGLRTTLYGEEYIYPYRQLFIYNFQRKILYPATSAHDVHVYIRTYNPNFGLECPDGAEGFGVPIF